MNWATQQQHKRLFMFLHLDLLSHRLWHLSFISLLIYFEWLGLKIIFTVFTRHICKYDKNSNNIDLRIYRGAWN